MQWCLTLFSSNYISNCDKEEFSSVAGMLRHIPSYRNAQFDIDIEPTLFSLIDIRESEQVLFSDIHWRNGEE